MPCHEDLFTQNVLMYCVKRRQQLFSKFVGEKRGSTQIWCHVSTNVDQRTMFSAYQDDIGTGLTKDMQCDVDDCHLEACKDSCMEQQQG